MNPVNQPGRPDQLLGHPHTQLAATTAQGGTGIGPGSVRVVESAALARPARWAKSTSPRIVAGWVAVGGAAGSATRVGIDEAAALVTDRPLGTLVSNVAGCFLLGMIIGRSHRSPGDAPPRPTALRTGAMTGFCGGLTTFSSFVLRAVVWPEGLSGSVLWLFGSVLFGVAAFWGGRAVGRSPADPDNRRNRTSFGAQPQADESER